MTDVTIYASPARRMAVHAPPHSLLNFAAHSMHFPNFAVTGCTFDACSNVRFMRVIGISLGFEPINSLPRRLFFSLGVSCKLFNLRAFGKHRFVATHAGINVRDRSVRGFVGVLVTKSAFKLRGVFTLLCHVLPVIERDRLHRSFRLTGRAQEHEPDHQNHHYHQHRRFDRSSHSV